MATQPSLRIGDRERDAVAAELQEHYARGRLTLEEFNQRLDAVFAAKTQGDLSQITADLPHVRSGGTPLPSSGTGRSPQLAGESLPGSRGAGGSSPVGSWSGGSWSGGSCRRGRFGVLTTLLAAVATWLLVYDVLLVGVHFAWPGRLGLLVAIFTLIRGLLRRIFRGGRRRW
jgi:uncharacterized membrane protein